MRIDQSDIVKVIVWDNSTRTYANQIRITKKVVLILKKDHVYKGRYNMMYTCLYAHGFWFTKQAIMCI